MSTRSMRPFIAHYGEHIADRSRPFRELELVLDRLARAGHRLAVCTNKLEWLSKRLLDTLHLATALPRSAAGYVRRCTSPTRRFSGRRSCSAGGDPNRAVMVGNFVTDIRTARRRRRPRHGCRFWLYGRAGGDARAGPGDQLLRGASGEPLRLSSAKNMMDDQAFIRQQY